MNNLSVRHIISLATYDFKHHFFSWSSLLLLQTVLLFIISLGTVFLGYQLSEYDAILFCLDLLVTGIVLLFPLVLLQNALDLAFDSQMRGMTLRGKIFEYCIAKLLQAFIVSLVSLPLIFCAMIIFFGYESATSVDFPLYFLHSFETIILTAVGLLTSLWTLPIVLVAISIGLYSFIRLQFVGLDILEYKSSIIQAFKNSYIITRHRHALLLPIVCLQLGSLFIMKFMIGFIISYLPIMIYDFAYIEVALDSIVFVAEGFVVVWMSLLSAHTYRQLVCPPSENKSCSSCTSC